MPQQINVPGMGVVEFPDGMSDDQISAAIKSNVPEQPSALSGAYKALDAGVAKGVAGIGGFLGEATNAGSAGIEAVSNFITDKLGVPRGQLGDPSKSVLNKIPTSETVGKAIQDQFYGGAEPYKPQNTTEKYLQTGGEFGVGLLGGGGLGALGRRAVTQVAAPAVASEAAGQAAENFAPQLEPYARVVGAVAGGMAPSALSRLVTPLPVNAERAAAANVLRNEGVTDLTAGQATGRKGLQYLEMERGNGANMVERQGEQFTRAALRRVGEDAPRATPEVVDRAFARIGQQFDDLAARNSAQIDNRLVHDLGQSLNNYHGLVNAPNRAPVVNNFLNEIYNAAQQNGGMIPGATYQSLRSRMEAAARNLGGNNEARRAVRDMREALDSAMERSIFRSGNAGDLGAWQNARREYRNMLVIEKAATGAGENAAMGIISPAKLREASVAQGRRGYARGQGEFADLARSGEALMRPLPNSGTPGRLAAQNLGAGTSAIVGATLGGGVGAGLGPAGAGVGAALGAAAGAAVPRVVGHLATSRPGRAYLSNQLLTPERLGIDPARAATINALIASQNQLPRK